jgi:amidase
MATETDGSITQPASRAALYGMKVTVGVVPTEGTSPWSPLTDSAGGMAKTPEDLASLIGIMMGKNFAGNLTKSWKGLKVGFVDPAAWPFSPHAALPDPVFVAQQREAYATAVQTVISAGGNVKEKVPIPFMEDMLIDGEDLLGQLFGKFVILIQS